MSTFEVKSKVFGQGLLSIEDYDWAFDGWHNTYIRGTWRVLSATPADWHREQVTDTLEAAGFEDDDDSDSEPGVTWTSNIEPKPTLEFFETPPGKWLTIVTDIGEVLGFEIVRTL